MPVPYEPVYLPLPVGVQISDTSLQTFCPTCEKNMQLRPRTMATHLIQCLREIARINYEESRPAVVEDIQNFSLGLKNRSVNGRTMNATYTELKYWMLIEPINIPVQRGNKVKNIQGWKITDQGRYFLAGAISIPERLWVFNDKPRENNRRPKNFITVKEVADMEEVDECIVSQESQKVEAT